MKQTFKVIFLLSMMANLVFQLFLLGLTNGRDGFSESMDDQGIIKISTEGGSGGVWRTGS